MKVNEQCHERCPKYKLETCWNNKSVQMPTINSSLVDWHIHHKCDKQCHAGFECNRTGGHEICIAKNIAGICAVFTSKGA